MENFNEFVKDLQPEPEPEKEKIAVSIDEINEEVANELVCPYCNYVPRKHSKDKQKAILNHIKKHHPERLNEYLNKNSIPIPEEPAKKVKKENPLELIKDYDCSYNLSTDEIKLKLVEDIDILNVKFPTLYKCPDYSYPESSVEHLQRIKNTYTRLINDKLTGNLAFNMLITTAKMGERLSDSLGFCDLEGFAGNIQQNQGEVMELLQELLDSQVISMEAVSPDIKICLCIAQIAIKTAENNRIEKKSQSGESIVRS